MNWRFPHALPQSSHDGVGARHWRHRLQSNSFSTDPTNNDPTLNYAIHNDTTLDNPASRFHRPGASNHSSVDSRAASASASSPKHDGTGNHQSIDSACV